MTKLAAQTYIGTKTVRAAELNRLDYSKLRGLELKPDENGADEGYLVEYTDGGKPNVPGFEGYVSWSPKDVFERSYKVQPASNLPAYQQRVVQEHADLSEKIDKLHDFFSTDLFNDLPYDHRELMKNQCLHMRLYADCLAQRITSFKKA